MYELFEHTADLGLRVCADTLEKLFSDAARGLFSVLVTNLAAVQPVLERTIEIAGNEYDYLLFDWLNELLYVFDTEKLVMCRFNIEFGAGGMRACCGGQVLDSSRHGADHEVKAITYHGLKVEPAAGGWLAEVIVDI